MNVLVIGCGALGQKIARMLDQIGWEVSVIDSREDVEDLMQSDFGGVVLRGFPMDLQILREGGIESCDAVAVVTSDDSLNITVAQIARDYFGVKNVVTRISDPARELIYENLGLRTICPTNLASEQIINLLSGEEPSTQLHLDAHTVSFAVRPASRQQIGRPLTVLQGYPGEVIFGLIRASGVFVLHHAADMAVPEAGDSIVYAKLID